eukprot:57289-Chlamydomonas_euryale.AAC.2
MASDQAQLASMLTNRAARARRRLALAFRRPPPGGARHKKRLWVRTSILKITSLPLPVLQSCSTFSLQLVQLTRCATRATAHLKDPPRAASPPPSSAANAAARAAGGCLVTTERRRPWQGGGSGSAAWQSARGGGETSGGLRDSGVHVGGWQSVTAFGARGVMAGR